MTQVFRCPVCSGALEQNERSLRCTSGHSFDIAKEGYVNLDTTSKKHSDTSGDGKDMVTARTLFLEGGYYNPLRDTICNLIKETEIKNPVLLDSGCGEGYYTKSYCETVSALFGKAYGVDLSKPAIKHAAKKCKDGHFAVASVYHLPITDESIDILVNCFSPLALEEFCRVVKKGGYFFYVVPDAMHLWELKKVLYDNPYENAVKQEEYDGFEFIKTESVTSRFTLDSSEKILSLLHMTPYTWKTPENGIRKLSELSSLDVTAQFRVMVYKRK